MSIQAAPTAVLAVVLLVIGAVIGAALDSERSKSPGAAARDSGSTQPTATPTPTREPRKADKPRKKRSRATATPEPKPPKPKRPVFVACDPNIRAKAGTTTCAFAQNVFYEYWYSWNYAELSAFAAYSAAAAEWFDMACTGAGTITCKADDGGEVRFPMSAVVAYTEANAGDYAADHTVSATPDDYNASEAPDYAEPDYSAPEPSFGGGDIDCSEISATDFPTPPGDPDGLDADGDGIACES